MLALPLARLGRFFSVDSSRFTRLLKRELINLVPKPETGIGSQGIEFRADERQQTALLCQQQNTDHTHRLQALLLSKTTPVLLIQQDEIGSQLERKRNALGFASVEIPLQSTNQSAIVRCLPSNPGSPPYFISTGPRPSVGIQFILDRLGNVDTTEKPMQKIELADCGEICQWRDIADNSAATGWAHDAERSQLDRVSRSSNNSVSS